MATNVVNLLSQSIQMNVASTWKERIFSVFLLLSPIFSW